MHAFERIMSVLGLTSVPFFPSAWFLRGMLAAEDGNWRIYLYWLGMLASSAFFLLQICAWLAPAIYYRGWRLAGESSTTVRNGKRFNSFRWLDFLLRPLSPPLRAMIDKDVKTFWRDPAQWSQSIILLGLLFAWVANLRSGSRYGLAFVLQNSELWKVAISFFNLAAACFILSILTTRFVYPLLSLEGKQFWAVGLAPVRRETMVWQKYWLCWLIALIMTSGLMMFSNFILVVSRQMVILSAVTVLMMSFALTSISIGLGALTPNFKEDNPARIANGMGGTMNVFLSLGYVGLIIGIEVWPAILLATGRLSESWWYFLVFAIAGCAFTLVNAAAIVIPMRMGLRHWRELEF